jgi:hypothetical protein
LKPTGLRQSGVSRCFFLLLNSRFHRIWPACR